MGCAIEGRLLEVCSCEGRVRAGASDDPDNGRSNGPIAYRYDRGHINDIGGKEGDVDPS